MRTNREWATGKCTQPAQHTGKLDDLCQILNLEIRAAVVVTRYADFFLLTMIDYGSIPS